MTNDERGRDAGCADKVSTSIESASRRSRSRKHDPAVEGRSARDGTCRFVIRHSEFVILSSFVIGNSSFRAAHHPILGHPLSRVSSRMPAAIHVDAGCTGGCSALPAPRGRAYARHVPGYPHFSPSRPPDERRRGSVVRNAGYRHPRSLRGSIRLPVRTETSSDGPSRWISVRLRHDQSHGLAKASTPGPGTMTRPGEVLVATNA